MPEPIRPIEIPEGAFSIDYTMPTIAKGILGYLQGQKEQETLDRQKALEDLANLIQLHGENVVNIPEFGAAYQRAYGKPWPTQQVEIPAVTRQVPAAEAALGQLPAGAPSPFEDIRPSLPGVAPVTQEIEPARKEVQPAPLGGQPNYFRQPLVSILGADALRQAGVPENLWKQPADQVLKQFPQLGSVIFSQKGALEAQKEEAKFIQTLLLGDLSRLSPSQLRMALQRYNALVQTRPEWGMEPVSPEISKTMIEESIGYQIASGRISLMKAQSELAQARVENLRAITPQQVQLLAARVYQIRTLTPKQAELLGARVKQALAEAQFAIQNKGMTPYQAAKLAMDAHFKTEDDQRAIIALWANLTANAQKVDPFTGAITPIPEVGELRDIVGAIAAPILEKKKPIRLSNGQVVPWEKLAEDIAELKANPDWTDQRIGDRLANMGINPIEFIDLIPTYKAPGTGR